MDDRDLIWAAGLFEGEGCITSRKKRSHAPHLHLGMVDLDVVMRFAMIIGVGKIYIDDKSRYKSHHQKQYRWLVSKESEVEQVMELLFPWLGKRRQEKWIEIKAARSEVLRLREAQKMNSDQLILF